jgi:hypothetical protein
MKLLKDLFVIAALLGQTAFAQSVTTPPEVKAAAEQAFDTSFLLNGQRAKFEHEGLKKIDVSKTIVSSYESATAWTQTVLFSERFQNSAGHIDSIVALITVDSFGKLDLKPITIHEEIDPGFIDDTFSCTPRCIERRWYCCVGSSNNQCYPQPGSC